MELATDSEATASNMIPRGCEKITPQMLAFIDADQVLIDRIVAAVPGGAANVQGIYPLTSCQESVLSNWYGADQDARFSPAVLIEVSPRTPVDAFVDAVQSLIDSHDILRAAVWWEAGGRSLQIIHRTARLEVDTLEIGSDGDTIERIKAKMEETQRERWNLLRAPLIRLKVARRPVGADGPWYALLQLHSAICDDESIDTIVAQLIGQLESQHREVRERVDYEIYLSNVRANPEAGDAKQLFGRKLADVEEAIVPFRLAPGRDVNPEIEECYVTLESRSLRRVQAQAATLGVACEDLFQAIWGIVLSNITGRNEVVFDRTVLAKRHLGPNGSHLLGTFVNSLPIRLNLQGVSSKELVLQAYRERQELVGYEETSPLAVRDWGIVTRSTPPFRTLFSYRREGDPPNSCEGVRTDFHVLAVTKCSPGYPIVLTVEDHGSGLTFGVRADRRFGARRIMGYVNIAVRSIVKALEQAPQTQCLALPILPDDERRRVTESFNMTKAPYPAATSIHELFEEVVRQSPDAVALISEGSLVTYGQLNRTANQVAYYLRAQGVVVGEYVPISLPRGIWLLISMLAVLKCGAAYVPIESTLPAERLAFIVRDCSARIMIVERACTDIGDWPIKQIDRVHLGNATATLPVSGHIVRTNGLFPAYVMYTSGSTGTPKGVVVQHRSVTRLIIDNGYAPIEATDRIGHCSNPAFDASTFEIWAALLTGASLVIVPQSILLEGHTFARVLRERCVTVLWLTVGLFNQYAEVLADVFGRLRYLLVGGDVVEPQVVRRVLHSGRPLHFINGYGPTEGTTFSATHEIVAAEEADLPIGRPISNTQVYILNGYLLPVPIGTAGEIHIGGAGVALGYLKRPELTAERFVSDPFSPDPGARLYRSGDIGRYRADGSIQFLGRRDGQVKIRGFRVELGEIESQLRLHSQVRDAVVLAREQDLGDRMLVAYVVAEDSRGEGTCNTGSERAETEFIELWRTLYEQTYSGASVAGNFVGWNSSYNDNPIPEPEMQEWLSFTVQRIQGLRPKRVLEIGCGVGLLLERLAPLCEVYVGTDFSTSALEQLRQRVGGRKGFEHITLLEQSANETQSFEPASFDMVVMNSVVQYFPSIEYLVDVLKRVVPFLETGGHVFIGDVRHLGLLPMFHGAVQLGKSDGSTTTSELRKRVARALAREKELAIDPEFFRVLPGRLDGISTADVQMKRGHALNEMTRYRYDVVLSKGGKNNVKPVPEQLEWQSIGGSLSELEVALRDKRWCAVRLISIPNSRLASESTVEMLIESSELEANELHRRLNEIRFGGINPESLWELGEQYGYDVAASWSALGSRDQFDAQFVDRNGREQLRWEEIPRTSGLKSWSAFANDPQQNTLRRWIAPQLREYLGQRLPSYMVPSAYVVMKMMPLNASGKVDRRALPAPILEDFGGLELEPPEGEIEEQLARIWMQVLVVERIGRRSNFFELGGHSLSATKLVAAVASRFASPFTIQMVFRNPTVQQMAACIVRLRSREQPPPGTMGITFEEGVI